MSHPYQQPQLPLSVRVTRPIRQGQQSNQYTTASSSSSHHPAHFTAASAASIDDDKEEEEDEDVSLDPSYDNDNDNDDTLVNDGSDLGMGSVGMREEDDEDEEYANDRSPVLSGEDVEENDLDATEEDDQVNSNNNSVNNNHNNIDSNLNPSLYFDRNFRLSSESEDSIPYVHPSQAPGIANHNLNEIGKLQLQPQYQLQQQQQQQHQQSLQGNQHQEQEQEERKIEEKRTQPSSGVNIQASSPAIVSSLTAPGISEKILPSNSVPNAAPTSSSSSSISNLKKSPSIPEEFGRRAASFAINQTRAFDRAVRGIDSDIADYVEDHVLETLDYESHEDTLAELEMEARGPWHAYYLTALKLSMMILIGFVTAMLMYGVSQGVALIFSNKIAATTNLIQSGQAAGAFFAFFFMNIFIASTGAAMVAILAPHARGGGVPYALSYLNGTNVAEYFSPRVVLVKTAALIFTIAGGLTLGMEGPFVFIGGGVALLCSNVIDRVFPFFFFSPSGRYTFNRIIRNIREERVFMAGGLAAGLAVAFDAPIAGVLFALEGSTAFLTVPVVLRIFGCAMFASFFNDLGHTNFSDQVQNHNLIVVSASQEPAPYIFTLWEIFPFTFVGIVGGFMGAGATYLNILISKWRHHHMEGRDWKSIGKQIAEVAIFAAITSVIFFVLPYIFGCRPDHSQCQTSIEELPSRCRQLQCPTGYYSEIGTIVYSTSDQIGRLLFDRSLVPENDFHVAPLLIYGLSYWALVSLLYGSCKQEEGPLQYGTSGKNDVPGGLFVPSIVIGGVYGRIIGLILVFLFPSAYINTGVYALLGAASMLGGFTRLALPVVLMLIELTGDATYLLPIMYCAVLAKFFADSLFPPLYPQHMALEKIPTLTDQLNPAIAKLQAHEVMIPKKHIASLLSIERLSVIKHVLLNSKRVIFPLLTPSGILIGLINRRAIMTAVSNERSYATYMEAQIFADKKKEDINNNNDSIKSKQGKQQPIQLTSKTRKSTSINANSSSGPSARLGRVRPSFILSDEDDSSSVHDWHSDTLTHANALSSSSFSDFEENYISLASYADRGIITAQEQTPTKRMAGLFRRLGISHLAVINREGQFLGIVTRRSLIMTPQQQKEQKEEFHKNVHTEDNEARKKEEEQQQLIASQVIIQSPSSSTSSLSSQIHPDMMAAVEKDNKEQQTAADAIGSILRQRNFPTSPLTSPQLEETRQQYDEEKKEREEKSDLSDSRQETDVVGERERSRRLLGLRRFYEP